MNRQQDKKKSEEDAEWLSAQLDVLSIDVALASPDDLSLLVDQLQDITAEAVMRIQRNE